MIADRWPPINRSRLPITAGWRVEKVWVTSSTELPEHRGGRAGLSRLAEVSPISVLRVVAQHHLNRITVGWKKEAGSEGEGHPEPAWGCAA